MQRPGVSLKEIKTGFAALKVRFANADDDVVRCFLSGSTFDFISFDTPRSR